MSLTFRTQKTSVRHIHSTNRAHQRFRDNQIETQNAMLAPGIAHVASLAVGSHKRRPRHTRLTPFLGLNLLDSFKLTFEFSHPSRIWVLSADTENALNTGPLLSLRWIQFRRFRRQVLCCLRELWAGV